MDSKSASEFVAADAVLAICQQPKRGHPLIERKRRILENGAHLETELLLALVAEPDAPCLDERVLCFAATWAGNIAISPAELNRVVERALRIGEVSYRFLECLGLIHAQILH